MKILKRTLLTGLCVSLATSPAFAQQDQQSNRQSDRDRQSQSQERDQQSRDRQNRDQQNRDQQRRNRGDSKQQAQYRISPTGWVRVAADYDNDGRFDAIETMFIYDLERARESSRQRANQQARKDAGRWQDNGRSQGMERMRDGGMRDSRQLGQRMRRDGKMRTYEQQRRTVSGEIKSLSSQSLAGADGQSLMARIDTEEGRTAVVCLGPKQQLSQLNLREGDRVNIEGVRGRVNDRSVLLARKVQSGDESVSVRMPDSRKLKRVRGEVLSKRDAKFRGQDEKHVLAKVRLVSGKQETVNLGPKSKVEQLDLQEGDDVSLLVRPGRVNGQPAMIAEQVRFGNDSIQVSSNRRMTSRRGRSNQQADGQRDRRQAQMRDGRRQQRNRGGQQDAQMDGQAALGIAVSDSEQGVQVEAIYPNSPAQQSQLREGDEIVSIDGESINSARQVIQKIQQRSPNERLEIETQRDGERKSFTVRLADRSELTGSNNRSRRNR